MEPINFSDDKLVELGLDTFTPGDVVYAQVKFTVEGEGTKVSGVKLDAVGPASDVAPEGVDLVDANDAAADEPANDSLDLEGADEGDEVPDAEEKMLGFKRPKKSPVPFPKASELEEGA